MSEALLAPLKKRAFSIEQLLSSEAGVFFENIFSTRHIGRVVDFMLFQCRDFLEATANPEQTEYRFRQALELLIFNGWTNYRAGERSKCVEVEFGADKGRLVFSVTYVADADLAGFVPGSGRPTTVTSARTAKMLLQAQALVDGLIVRHEPQAGRVQAIAFLSAQETEKLPKAEYVDVATLPEEAPAASPAVAEPAELSTGNLDGFLADENAPPPATPVAAEPEQVVSGEAPTEDTTETVVKASEREVEQLTTISGSGPVASDEAIRVAGGPADAQDETLTKIAGGGPVDLGGDKTVTKISGGGPKDLGGDKTVTKFSGGGPNDVSGDKTVMRVSGGAQGAANQRQPAMQVRRLAAGAAQAGDAGPSKREKLLEDQLKTLQTQIEALKSEKKAMQDNMFENGRATTPAEPGAAAPEPVVEDVADDSSALTKLSEEIDKGGVPDAAKTWAKNMMETAIKERSELRDKMRTVDATLRRREHEFKTRESSLNEQLRGLDATIKQRDSALEKAKQNATILSATLEKLREEHADTDDKIGLTHKLVTVEKLLAAEKDVNERNQKRLDDFQKKINDEVAMRGTVQQEAVKQKKLAEELQRKVTVLQEQGSKGTAAEIQTLTDQRDKNARMVEEFKRQIRELQSKLSAATSTAKTVSGTTNDKKGSTGQSEAELKHKVELAEKLAKNSKDELDKTKKRLEEVKAAESKMRTEISKLQVDLTKAHADLKAAGIRSAAAAASAAKPAAGVPKGPTGKPGAKK